MEEYLTLFVNFGLPVLPYMGIAFITYQIMSKFVKPLIASHKGPDGLHHELLWLNARRGMVFYPMILGYIMGMMFPGLLWGYSVLSGASAQLLYLLLKAYLKRKGVDLPVMDGSKSMMLPAVQDENSKEK